MSNVEQAIDELTKEKKPKKRKYLKTNLKPSHQIMDNKPPRRFGPTNPQGLYPVIGIENFEEQRRLANIADQISHSAHRLAMENGRQNLENDVLSNQSRFKQVK
jgi:hypothetical protein